MQKTRSKAADVKDTSGILDQLVENLVTKGSARFMHFGLFKVVSVTGRKRYSFQDRKMVPIPRYITVSFSPAQGLRDMLNEKGRRLKTKKK